MDGLQALSAVRAASDVSVADLAARAGLSAPTLYRLFRGAVPRVDDLRELALASGWDLELELRPVSDPLAGVAARLELGDDSVGAWRAAAEPWRERLRRFVDTDRTMHREAALVAEGGRATGPRDRAGAVYLRGDHRAVDRLVSAGRASARPWALSGWAALDALGVDADAPTIMWVEDATAVGQLLNDSFRPGRAASADLIVVPAHPTVFADAAPIEDVELVAPLQARIDAVGLGGDARARVLADLGGLR